MYVASLWIGFFIWLTGLVMFFVMINSQFERNLRKVSCRLSWLSMAPKSISEADAERGIFGNICKFLFIQTLGLASVLLGPIYVAYAVGSFIYVRVKDTGAPTAVKEARWKLRNVDLSKEEIEALVDVMAKIGNVAK